MSRGWSPLVVLSGCFLITAPLAMAEAVYRATDEAGRPVFTDQPGPGAREVELPPVNTLKPVVPQRPITTDRPEESGYKGVRVAVPRIVPNGLAPLTIRVETTPSLRKGHRWRLVVDGALVTESTASGYTFDRMARGSHQVHAEVVDSNGRVLAISPMQDFFVYWPGGN